MSHETGASCPPTCDGSDPTHEPVMQTRLVSFKELPRIIAEALDAADKRREARAMSQLATQNLESMRAKFSSQLDVLVRFPPTPEMVLLVSETRSLLALIDEKLALAIGANADMLRESIRQALAALEGRPDPQLTLLPGADMIAKHWKRR